MRGPGPENVRRAHRATVQQPARQVERWHCEARRKRAVERQMHPAARNCRAALCGAAGLLGGRLRGRPEGLGGRGVLRIVWSASTTSAENEGLRRCRQAGRRLAVPSRRRGGRSRRGQAYCCCDRDQSLQSSRCPFGSTATVTVMHSRHFLTCCQALPSRRTPDGGSRKTPVSPACSSPASFGPDAPSTPLRPTGEKPCRHVRHSATDFVTSPGSRPSVPVAM